MSRRIIEATSSECTISDEEKTKLKLLKASSEIFCKRIMTDTHLTEHLYFGGEQMAAWYHGIKPLRTELYFFDMNGLVEQKLKEMLPKSFPDIKDVSAARRSLASFLGIVPKATGVWYSKTSNLYVYSTTHSNRIQLIEDFDFKHLQAGFYNNRFYISVDTLRSIKDRKLVYTKPDMKRNSARLEELVNWGWMLP